MLFKRTFEAFLNCPAADAVDGTRDWRLWNIFFFKVLWIPRSENI